MNDVPREPAVIPGRTPYPVQMPPSDLPEEDGEPLESFWHRLAMSLLIESLSYFWRDRNDFFVGGNMFLYFSEEQILTDSYRGPDFFFVWDVDRHKPRGSWATWKEGGRYPNVIIELISPTTEKIDRTTKKNLYEQTFCTQEYFLYDPDKELLEGWRLSDKGRYKAIKADERGWLWSEQFELWLGKWTGPYWEIRGVYPRFYDNAGKLILVGREDQEQRADAAKQQAAAAGAEVARLKARLAELEGKAPRSE